MTSYIKVPEEQFVRILRGYNMFNALRNGGVDNWEHYGDALYDYLLEWGKEDGLDEEQIEEIGYTNMTRREIDKNFMKCIYD